MAFFRSVLLILVFSLSGTSHATLSCDNLFSTKVTLLNFVRGSSDGVTKGRQSFEKATQPKDWSVEEISIIKSLFARLEEYKQTKSFFERIRKNGFKKLQRFGRMPLRGKNIFGFTKYSPAPENFLASVPHLGRTVEIYDGFFTFKRYIDPQSQFGSNLHILLHELVHVFDRDQFSQRIEFRSLSGWQKNYDPKISKIIDRIEDVDFDEFTQIKKNVLALKKAGHLKEAHEIGTRYAHQFGLPSLYSFENPSECFAEVVSAVLLDPTVETYMSPRLVKWIRTQVFTSAE